MGFCSNYVAKYGDCLYLLFRALVGVLFFLHGWAKFAQGTPQGLMLVAGILELAIGVGIFLGFFTRLVATVGAVQMIVAYVMVHAGQGLNPLNNDGELAVLFFAAFLVLMVYGSKRWSLEQAALKKEVF